MVCCYTFIFKITIGQCIYSNARELIMRRAGEYEAVLGFDYKAFKPASLQSIDLAIDTEMLGLISEANLLLGKLDGLALAAPDKYLFISSYVRKEALLSSQIEGTQTSLEDILSPIVSRNRNPDVIDVVKYVEALHYALNRLGQLPISGHLIRETHGILLSHTRGYDKNTGNDLGITFKTASAAIGRLTDLGILKQANNAKRERIFGYEAYLGILRKDTENL